VETILVLSTCFGRSVNDEPRVEIIVREELEEKAIMRTGNISTLVAETGACACANYIAGTGQCKHPFAGVLWSLYSVT
jgi:hypothetical protein